MDTYFMFGKFTNGTEWKISAERTRKTAALINGLGGEIKAAYALLGESDVVLIVELPGMREAMKASIELTKLLGIVFTTSLAVSVEEFDKLIEGG